MMMSIKMEFHFENPEVILKSIEVDNVDIPKGMKILSEIDGSKLVIRVQMEIHEPKDLLTLKNTADEIMRHAEAIIRTMKGINI